MQKKSLLIGIILGVVLLSVWIYFVDIKVMLRYWDNISWLYLSLSTFFYLLSYFVRSLRWRLILKPIIKLNFKESFLYLFSGNFINYLIPIRAGELARSVIIKKKYKIKISESLPSVFLDKIFDTFGIVLVLIMLPFLNVSMNWQLKFIIISLSVIFVIGIFMLVYASFYPEKIKVVLLLIVNKFPLSFKNKIINMIDKFIKGMVVFNKNKKLLINVLVFTLISILVDGLFFWFSFKSINVTLPFFQVLFGYTLIFLSYILPQPPAQIGTNEGMMMLVFTLGMGYNKEMVSAVMTLSHLLTGAILIIGGSIATTVAGFNLMNFKNITGND